MKLIEGNVIGTRFFTSKKNNKTYNVAYVSFEVDGVQGLACCEVFTNTLLPVGSSITGCYDGYRFKEVEMI